MKHTLFILLCISFFFTTLLNAEKKQFEYNAVYTINELDTPDSAQCMVMELTHSYYKGEIEKFLTKQNVIKIFNYSSSDMQDLIANYYTIRVISENTTSSSIHKKSSVVIDTDLYVSFFSKVKNHPDTFRYFKELIKTNDSIVSQINTLVKKINSLKSDAEALTNARKEYSTLITALRTNKLLLQSQCLFMAQNDTSFLQFLDTNYNKTTVPPWVQYASALIYTEKKDFEKAKVLLTELRVNTSSDSLIPYYSTIIEARLNSNRQSESKALALYDSALKLQPNLAEVYLYRAQFFTNIGKYQQAAKDYDSFLKTSPMSADILYEYSITLSSLLKDKEARETMTKAARYGNEQAILWLNKNKTSQKRTTPAER